MFEARRGGIDSAAFDPLPSPLISRALAALGLSLVLSAEAAPPTYRIDFNQRGQILGLGIGPAGIGSVLLTPAR